MKNFSVLLILMMCLLLVVGCCGHKPQLILTSGNTDVHEFQTALDSSVLIQLRSFDLIQQGAGSGVAYERTPKGMTRILTAGHVCDFALVAGLTPWVVSLEHGLAQAEVLLIWGSEIKDLCIIETALDIPVAELAEMNAEFGAPIWNVSAPGGEYPLPFKGYVAGPDETRWRVRATLYGRGGMSGSAIWQDGKVAGILVERATVAAHIPTSAVVRIIPSWRIEEFLTLVDILGYYWEAADEEATTSSP